jgi:putative redox protein
MKRCTRRVYVSEVGGFVGLKLESFIGGVIPLSSDSKGTASKFSCRIDIGRHNLKSDLKDIEDGADDGPSPKELCYSALGSCTVMTIRTFFENTKAVASSTWADSNLRNISVTLDEVNGPDPHHPVGIDLLVTLEGNLSGVQKNALLRAASNCPVKKMLNGALKIKTSLA